MISRAAEAALPVPKSSKKVETRLVSVYNLALRESLPQQ